MIAYSLKPEIDNLIDKKTLTYNNYGKVIRFKNDVNAFRFNELSGKHNEYYFLKYATILWETFKTIMPITKGLYVLPYEYSWHAGYHFNSKRINCKKCLIETDEEEVIYEIFIMALKSKAFPIFTNKENNMSVIPTDHLDMFVAYSQFSPFSEQLIYDDLELSEW